MLRTVVMALLGALLFASPALAQSSRTEILRDCQDDGSLKGDYTAEQLRDARNNIPAEVDEYSDCRDVLTRGINAKTSSTKSTDDGGSGGGGGGTTSGSGGGGGGSNGGAGSGGSTSTGDGEADSPAASLDGGETGLAAPYTQQEWNTVNEAHKQGAEIAKDLKQVSPGATRLTADVGRNQLPGPLVGVLALIAAAALSIFAAPLIRRRGLGPRQT